MYQRRIVACLLGLLGVIGFAKSTLSMDGKPLPSSLEAAVLKQASEQGLTNPPPQVAKAESTTWQDCLPASDGFIPLNSCKAVERSGWRVTVKQNREAWVYYVATDGFITLDGPASLNAVIKAALPKHLATEPKYVQVVAARPQPFFRCPTKDGCITARLAPQMAWKILVAGRRPLHLDLQGKLVTTQPDAPLPVKQPAEVTKVLRRMVQDDLSDRLGALPASLQLSSARATTWNWCRGRKGPGPTPPEMGMCMDVDQSGWQLLASFAGNRFVYYVTQGSSVKDVPSPDGMQSVPKRVMVAVQKAAAQRAGVKPEEMRVQSVSPAFFDGCLNGDSQKLYCRQQIQGGWAVMAIGGTLPLLSRPGMATAWFYSASLSGDEVQFVRSGNWAPPP